MSVLAYLYPRELLLPAASQVVRISGTFLGREGTRGPCRQGDGMGPIYWQPAIKSQSILRRRGTRMVKPKKRDKDG